MPNIQRARICALALLALPLACDDAAEASEKADAPAMLEKVEGKITLGGKEAKVASCKVTASDPGYAAHIELEGGLTIVYDVMAGTKWQKEGGELQALECEKNQASMSGGKAPAGAFMAGTWALKCTLPDGALEADLTIDCGPPDRPSNRKPKG